MNEINNTFLKFSKRSETLDVDYLVKTFVNVGPLFTILSNKEHEIVYGRRGTGKTHALLNLKNSINNANEISVYIDLRTIGSNGGIFSDSSISVVERATRLLIDTITFIVNNIVDTIISDETGKYDLSRVSPIADKIWDSINEIKIESEIEKTENTEENSTDSTQKNRNFEISNKGVNYGREKKTGIGSSVKKLTESKIKGISEHRIHFASLFSNLKEFTQKLKTDVWILIDEWAEVPQELQPYLAELLRRTILPNPNFILKIAAIEQRTNISFSDVNSNRIGIEIGADIATTQNLDEYMVFDNDEEKSKEFFKELIFHHFINTFPESTIRNADELISIGFSQINSFTEFVRSSEGIPRDAINILSIAASKANDNKISIENVRSAARTWYGRGKEKAITSNQAAHKLLLWIIDEVIGQRSARAFLLQTNKKDKIIDYLFDSRVLHIIKENISGKDKPGLRYNVYSIDYGCYVDLLNTKNAPKGLFAVIDDSEDDETEIYIDVPKTDYRAIRRAILDLDEFYKQIIV
ncbi:hypothetical protein [Myroides sp. DF42-4-2]|uniref:hypothetical protein n=1 Tax=Myroides sp. DF42-4-2 TaxID=2746726 RepID=UPI00257764E4|nr:hypothetical protein [Myroides sp. DF42-4-2]MDM1409021.1 hypothetical protein [Myroides sp. DF42-4-2]